MDLDKLQTRSLPAAHLPVIRGCIDKLGIMEVLDEALPQHPLANASDAECVVAMILNILGGRVALWRMDKWLERVDLELVLGEGVQAGWFNDTRLGECLDHADAVGTDTLLAVVVSRYLARLDGVEPFTVHLDTTSLSLYGAYEVESDLVPTYGFSKDHRPDLKQLVFGLSVHGSQGIPLTMSVNSGNTSDQAANRDHLSRLATLLPDPQEATIVADCKLVDATTLGQLMRSGFHFISLVPESFSVRGSLIDRAWTDLPDVDSWPVLAERPGPKRADPVEQYRGFCFEEDLAVHLGQAEDGSPSVSLEPLRFVVVHSDRLRARFDKSLPDKLEREAKVLKKRRKASLTKEFACAADARKAAEKLCSSLKLNTATIEVSEQHRRRKRPGPGRPRKDETPTIETFWQVEISLRPDEDRIAQLRRRASCFVLVSDWMPHEKSDVDVLAEYRHQALIEGHTGFRWMKSAAQVAPVMLNRPERIRALGLVFVLALMVRNYIQFTLRAAMKDRGQGILHPFRKKEDDNLTTEMALEWFGGVNVVFVSLEGAPWQRTPPALNDQALDVLYLLGLNEQIYARPPPR